MSDISLSIVPSMVLWTSRSIYIIANGNFSFFLMTDRLHCIYIFHIFFIIHLLMGTEVASITIPPFLLELIWVIFDFGSKDKDGTLSGNLVVSTYLCRLSMADQVQKLNVTILNKEELTGIMCSTLFTFSYLICSVREVLSLRFTEDKYSLSSLLVGSVFANFLIH